MFDIIPLVLILLSLSVIAVIVVRKFSVLANLNIDTIQVEREARFKEQIISNRIKRNWFRYYMRVVKVARPAWGWMVSFAQDRYAKIVTYRDNAAVAKKNVKPATEESVDDMTKRMFFEADEFIKNDDFDAAEKIYIAIIGLDSQNTVAFKSLGELYLSKKNYVEAKQTMEHAIRLSENVTLSPEKSFKEYQLAGIYFNLAGICRDMENFDEAVANIDKALSIEPNNPRYLDTKLEISIMKKDGEAARRVFAKLKEVNPENQKLDEVLKQIEEL